VLEARELHADLTLADEPISVRICRMVWQQVRS
jgi:hypothetical protein